MSGCRRSLPASLLCFWCWSRTRSHKQQREWERQRSQRKARSVSQFKKERAGDGCSERRPSSAFLRLALITSGHYFSGVVNEASYFYDPSWPGSRRLFVKVLCLCVALGTLRWHAKCSLSSTDQ